MRYVLLLLTFTICYNVCLAQDVISLNDTDSISIYHKWRTNWKYFKLKKKITGVILEQHPTGILCGNVMTASNSIIVTTKNDTIRVLELCNVNKSFSKFDKVEIIPDQTTPLFVNFIPLTKFDKDIKRTTYGLITKIK